MIDPQLIKAAERTPVVSDVADLIRGGRPHLEMTPSDRATMRLGGGALGAAGGGIGGGLAGLLGHYATARKNKRDLKDYLKSMLIGGGLGAGVGGAGLGWFGGALADEIKRTNTGGA
jgi:hypothetical protein